MKVDNNVNLPRARVKLRNLVSQYIDQHTHYGVLAIFNQGTEEYRLSLVAKETELIDGEIVTRETPPKRYTYLLGPGESCRTATDRLSALPSAPPRENQPRSNDTLYAPQFSIIHNVPTSLYNSHTSPSLIPPLINVH